MDKVTWWQWSTGVVATIFLGALGSGLWDAVFKGWYNTITRIGVQIITLGYKASRDTLYLEAARGHNDRSSLWIVYVIILFGLPTYFVNQPYLNPVNGEEILRSADEAEAMRLSKTQDVKTMSLEQLAAQNLKLKALLKADEEAEVEKIRRLRNYASLQLVFDKIRWLLIVGSFLAFSVLVLRALRLSYISKIITEYQQRFTICRPFISEGEQWIIASRFAQMITREEYEQIMRDLKNAVKAQKLQLPSTQFS